MKSMSKDRPDGLMRSWRPVSGTIPRVTLAGDEDGAAAAVVAGAAADTGASEV
jgi:hypothetical protein